MKIARSILALALSAGAAHAQSFNVDINAISGAGAGAPGSGFGGPAVSSGTWNTVSPASPTTSTLFSLNGNLSSVTLTRATNGTITTTNSASTNSSYELLLDDYQFISLGTMTFTFDNLANGTYAVYVCGVDPASTSNRSNIQVVGAQSSSVLTQQIGGSMTSNTFHAGVTHSVHFKNVTNGQISINVADSFNARGVISGIQLVQLANPTQRLRLYVDKNAVGNNDGSSWTNAMTDLQSALDAASLGGGSHFEVWVASAFYYPGTTRESTFNLATGLKLYGGFAGTESTLAQRVYPLNSLTYLAGSIGTSAETDNCYTVVTMTNPDGNNVVDGFYIARGYNNDSGHGGGMSITGGAPFVIRNCSFTTNSAANGGAAIYSNDAFPKIFNTTFYKGDAWNGVGGAIEAVGGLGSLTVQNCRFLGNYATGEGGAIYTNAVPSDISNCLFSGNTTSFQGGAIRVGGATGTLTLRNCTLSMNASSGSCGGVYASGGADAVLYNSIVWGNTGGTGGTVASQGLASNSGSGSVITTEYCTLQGSSPNPMFINAAGADNDPGNFDDNCHLMQGSPAMDRGDINLLPNDLDDLDDNGVTSELIPVDLDGQARRVEILSAINGGVGLPPVDRGCYEFQLSSWCYANCDDSVGTPALTANDFQCFINKYAVQDPYANCDGSTGTPALTANDFQCYINKYALGCP